MVTFVWKEDHLYRSIQFYMFLNFCIKIYSYIFGLNNLMATVDLEMRYCNYLSIYVIFPIENLIGKEI